MTTRLTSSVARPYASLLYELLPAIYRAEDSRGELRAFVSILGAELDAVRANTDQWRDDFFVDSCQPWVLPYIGDLVAADVMQIDDAARVRAVIKNTIRWRRRKGTLIGLEDIAAEVTGSGARVVEMLERMLWTQRVDHLRPRAAHALDLRSPPAMAQLATAFDAGLRTVDLRMPAGRTGLHRPRALAVHQWPLATHVRRGCDVAVVSAERWCLDPLGRDVPLYADRAARAHGERVGVSGLHSSDIGAPHADNVPIRGRDFGEHPLVYFGAPGGFTVFEDGIPLCRTAETRESRLMEPALRYARLRTTGGLLVADASVFAAADVHRISQVRYGLQTRVDNGVTIPVPSSPGKDFPGNFTLGGVGGRVDLPANAWTNGVTLVEGAPNFHQAPLLLAIERTGASATFPESELVVLSAFGESLLVYLPALNGLVGGSAVHLWVAADGSTYFARHLHDAGPPELNPDSELFGALLPDHLARAAQGQARPRPGARPLRFREARYLPLRCWDRPLVVAPSAGEVAFDPATGRMVVPAGEAPTGTLTAEVRSARTWEVGAGPFFRPQVLTTTLTVATDRPADFTTIQAAIAAAPALPNRPVVIEVLDSRTYRESLSLNGRVYPAGLVLRSAPGETPVLLAPGPVISSNGATRLGVRTVDGRDVGGLSINGLVLMGGPLVVRGDVGRVELSYCTLDAASVTVDMNPSVPATLVMRRTIAGVVTAGATVQTVEVSDSAALHPAVTAIDHAAHRAIEAPGLVTIDRSTLLGGVKAQRLRLSNSIVWGALDVGDGDGSCLRYSRWTRTLLPLAGFASTDATPVFLSLREQHPGFLHLHTSTADSLRRGAENGGEMGVWYGAGLPWRQAHLERRLDEYVPAGLEVAHVRELPVCGFSGEIRP